MQLVPLFFMWRLEGQYLVTVHRWAASIQGHRDCVTPRPRPPPASTIDHPHRLPFAESIITYNKPVHTLTHPSIMASVVGLPPVEQEAHWKAFYEPNKARLIGPLLMG